uniref:Uncharacterized protein n=1 Tax=Arundo donax TaxID=35708 RepID=A0A0A9DZM2_ARUDO
MLTSKEEPHSPYTPRCCYPWRSTNLNGAQNHGNKHAWRIHTQKSNNKHQKKSNKS